MLSTGNNRGAGQPSRPVHGKNSIIGSSSRASASRTPAHGITSCYRRAGGPLGTLDLGGRADGKILTYWYGSDFVSFEGAGSSYSALDWWKAGVGSSPPQVDGVVARYPSFYPSTALEVVSGIDGAEMVLEMRSPTFVGRGNLSYSFWVDPSPMLYPGVTRAPL